MTDQTPHAGREAAPRPAAEKDVLPTIGIEFVTANASDDERAAVYAVLAVLKQQESQQVRSVTALARNPWRRSQRVPEGIPEYLD
ncbi:hypothetical protein GCM10022198_10190 [Klugiella xanthotipulae]|uniref:Acyl-CoA carboxylase epsilon subunit-like protein n=1 Tax=Klugiella xanthotipulae TaxID=244735 RepID=A0A543HYJ4_9MICO|nr:hypothetical protein [Klugiella xanthotipulae]TQM63417.1 hypothetical protein FB466_1679 [Klugiella xanthotipulae]